MDARDALVMVAEHLDTRARDLKRDLTRAEVAQLLANAIAQTPPPGSIPKRVGTPVGVGPTLSGQNLVAIDLPAFWYDPQHVEPGTYRWEPGRGWQRESEDGCQPAEKA